MHDEDNKAPGVGKYTTKTKKKVPENLFYFCIIFIFMFILSFNVLMMWNEVVGNTLLLHFISYLRALFK